MGYGGTILIQERFFIPIIPITELYKHPSVTYIFGLVITLSVTGCG
jgi:hypothetical protein